MPMIDRSVPAVALTLAMLAGPAPSGAPVPHPCQAQAAGQTLPAVSFGENDEIPLEVRRATFRFVWEKLRDDYFDPAFGGVDWEKIRETFEPGVEQAARSGMFHSLLREMVGRLDASHLAIRAPHQLTREKKSGENPLKAPERVELRIVEGRVTISRVDPDTPAWNSGLRPGHIIVGIDALTLSPPDESKASRLKALAEARRAMAGDAATPASFRVLGRDNGMQTLLIPRTAPFEDRANLARAKFEHRLLGPRLGYIRFDSWSFDLPSKLAPALEALRVSEGIIIDLRQNGGGVNPGVDYLASALHAQDGMLATSARRNGDKRDWTFSGSGEQAYRGRVAILIDDGSGSASEVFAAALQESGRAVVLGRTSYGGVLNSTQEPLPTGGILQYPHSDIRTPRGKRIEGLGVRPDIAVELERTGLLDGRDTVIERAVLALTERGRR